MTHSRRYSGASELSVGNSFVEFSREEIEQSIVDRFEQQVAKHGGKLAIKTGHSSLTYEDLNQHANRIANAILARGGRRHEPVALLAENYVLAVAGILGILKAGKIYVPLDGALPASRVRLFLQDAGVRLVVAGRKSRGWAQKFKAAELDVVDIAALRSDFSDKNIGLVVRPDALAWILYTSSSTGEPKGVPQTHRGELHNIMNMTNSQRLCNDDRMTLLRSPILGGAIRNTFSALLNGASLFPFDIKTEGFNGLAEWLVRERITIFHSAATLFRSFVQTLSGHESFPMIRLIRLGSEPVTSKDVDLFRKHFSSECILVNALSSTEGRTFLQYFVSRNTPVAGGTLPVGFPVQDVGILLLDEAGREVEHGKIGEIALRSQYLFPGYWRRPKLTREVLLRDPEGGDLDIFRTGDLGRMLPDGSYEYHGRKDFQHKIRGYRVQTDEVEMALGAIPDIAQAAVLAIDSDLKKRLVAYFVPIEGRVPTVGRLRNALRKKLPDFMIPSAFVPLKCLPLTSGGKVDRRAIPAFAKSRVKLDQAGTRPRTRLEKLVARIWCESLNKASIGVHDNFFDLGGDSLSAAQIASKVRAAVGIEVRLETIFRAETVAGLAAHIQKMLEQRAALKAPPMVRVPFATYFPLSYAQAQLWVLNQLLPGTSLFNICDARRLRGTFDGKIMMESLKWLMQRHEALRTQFTEMKGHPVQIIAKAMEPEMPVVDLCDVPTAQREARAYRMAADDANVSFDLATGPLVAMKLFRLAQDDHLLLVTMHHIIGDQWSMQIFRHELALIYGAISRGLAPSLPDLPIRFVDFVCWEQQAMTSGFMKAQLAYWEKQLAGSLRRLIFKHRSRRNKRIRFQTSRLPIQVDEKLFAAVRAFGRRERSTPFMILIAALSIMLHMHTGQCDIRIGTLVANRSGAGTERIIGHLINTVVLRQRLSSTLTLREVLAQARENTLAAQANQNVPFEALIRFLEKKRKIERAALFQVMFIYHNTIFHPTNPPGPVFSWPDLLWEKADYGVTLTTCDLICVLKETSGGLAGYLTFKSDIFDSAVVSAIWQTFVRALESTICSPESTVARLAVGERQKCWT